MRPAMIAVAAAALALAGCIRDPDPFTIDDDHVSIHFILEAGADSVLARITVPGEGFAGAPVPDAAVRFIAGQDTVPLTYDPETTGRCAESWGPTLGDDGCYQALLPAAIEAGGTYDLEVVLADGSRITGRTTVPLPVTLTAPSAGEVVVARCNGAEFCYGQATDTPPYTIPVAEVVFRWADPVERSRVGAGVRPRRAFIGAQDYPGDVCQLGFFGTGVSADSVVWPIPNITCTDPLSPARFDSIHAEGIVYTRNGEYVRYLEAISDGPTVRASAVAEGLEGPAWGVFGAVAAARRPITIVRDPPPAPPF